MDALARQALADPPAGAADPERRIWIAEAGALVRRALAELPGEQRETIEIAYFEGLTQSEIAARTNTPLGTVKTRMRQAILRLRGALTSLLAEESAP